MSRAGSNGCEKRSRGSIHRGGARRRARGPSQEKEDQLTHHQIKRVRHETRRRLLSVQSIEDLGPTMRRIHFSGDLAGFVSASADDHIKLFFAPEREGERPIMRDFTPRSFDTALGTIVIDFALHEAGPATGWAGRARIGDTLEIGGPRGSAVIPDDFDWYLLVGDETALPAIGRRIEELRPGVPVISAVVIGTMEDAQRLETRAAWQPGWALRDGSREDAALLIEALDAITLPEGEGFVWIAAETGVARALRSYMLETRGHPRAWMKAAGYWTRGHADAHERIDD